MASVTLPTGGSVPKVLENPMKERNVIRIIDIVRKENSMDKVQKIREEVEKLHGNPYYMMAVKDALAIIDSLQEEPISDDLEKAAKAYSNNLDNIYGSIGEQTRNAFKAGAEWQKQKTIKKACEWLDKNTVKYIITKPIHETKMTGLDVSMVDDFKEAMEG